MGKRVPIKFLRFWFPVILYSAIIFYVSSIPDLTSPYPKIWFDKILHVLEYMPFGFLLARGICGQKPTASRTLIWMVVIFSSFLFAVSDEIHQWFVPGRNAGVIDLITDMIGGIFGGYLYIRLTDRKRSSLQKSL